VVIPHHVGRLELLVIDRIILADKRQCCLVVEVPPLASHLLMRSRQEVDCLAPARTATLSPSDAPLRCLESALGFTIPARMEDARPI
jgi:hypothetical protein